MQRKIRRLNNAPQASNLLIILVCISTFVVRVISNTNTTQNIALIILIVAGAVGYYHVFRSRSNLILLYSIVALMGWFIGFMLRPSWQYEFKFFVNSLMYMGVAYLFLNNNQNEKYYMLLYYTATSIIFFFLIVLKVPIRGFMKDGSSYNFISVISLFYLSMYSITRFKNKKDISYISIGAFLIIVITAYGRGGILTAGVLVLCTVVLKAIENKRKLRTYACIILVTVALVIFGENILGYVLGSGYLEKFQLLGFETGRTLIWGTFVEGNLRNFSSFLIGSDPTVWVSDGNLHNSFLQMYVCFGVVFFAWNIVLIILSTISNIKNKEYWLVVLFIVFFVRAFLDRLLFRSYMEIIYFYYIFNYLDRRSHKRIVTSTHEGKANE